VKKRRLIAICGIVAGILGSLAACNRREPVVEARGFAAAGVAAPKPVIAAPGSVDYSGSPKAVYPWEGGAHGWQPMAYDPSAQRWRRLPAATRLPELLLVPGIVEVEQIV
jgi:hypothetical protein